jgi:hypothetical protein
MLFRMLEAMVEGSVLEKNDEYQYRWNKKFKGIGTAEKMVCNLKNVKAECSVWLASGNSCNL